MRKRILSIVTILCMMLVLLPSMAFADDNGGGNDTSYTDLGEYLETANKVENYWYVLQAGNYRLNEDITLGEGTFSDVYGLIIKGNAGAGDINVTLDLNGHTLTTNGTVSLVRLDSEFIYGSDNSYVNLTVEDNSDDGNGSILAKGNYAIVMNNYSKFTLSGGTIQTIRENEKAVINAGQAGEINLTGGTITDNSGENKGIFTSDSSSQIVNIGGCTINGDVRIATETLTVTSGKITGDMDIGKWDEELPLTVTIGSEDGGNNAPTITGDVTVTKVDGFTINAYSGTIAGNLIAAISSDYKDSDVKFSIGQDGNSTIIYGSLLKGTTAETGDEPVPLDLSSNGLYKVTFMQNYSATEGKSDTEYANILVQKDSKVSKPADPTRDSYEFTGWYTKSGDGDNAQYTEYPFAVDETSGVELSTKTVTGNTTLYAGWEEAEPPVISGITDGQTYCGETKFTVTDKNGVAGVGYYTTDSSSVTTLTADDDGNYTLPAGIGTVTVVAADKSGNETTVKVTVNSGHTPKEADDGDCTTAVACKYCSEAAVAAKEHDFTGGWKSDKDGHWHVCKNDDCTKTDTKVKHSGTDDGNCTTAVTCECGYVITEAETDHNFSDEWKSDKDGHWHVCKNDDCTQTGTKTKHSGTDDGDCTTAVTCECGYVITQAKDVHTWGDWKYDKDGQHIRYCTATGCGASETEACTYEWQSDSEYYWQECEYCDYSEEKTTASKTVPAVSISGDDEVCEGSDYTFTFTVPEGVEVKNIETGYTCGELDGQLEYTQEGNTYTVVISSDLYDENADTLEASAYITLVDGFKFEITKTVDIYTEQSEAAATTDDDTATTDSDTTKADGDKSSETGDNFNMGLLIALLIAAGGTFTATLYRRRSTKH